MRRTNKHIKTGLTNDSKNNNNEKKERTDENQSNT